MLIDSFQICTLLEAPKADFAKLAQIFPADVVERVQEIHENCPSVGAYSASNGLAYVRKAVARFIEERDGFSSNPDQIYLTNGASEGIFRLLNAIVAHPNVGVFLPIPQYPLYSAAMSMLDGQVIRYELDEKRGWALDLKNLKSALKIAKKRGIDARAFVSEQWREQLCNLFNVDLYCIVLYCIVLYCIVLYCIVLYCIVCMNYVCSNVNFSGSNQSRKPDWTGAKSIRFARNNSLLPRRAVGFAGR
jgi:hypothetical protein